MRALGLRRVKATFLSASSLSCLFAGVVFFSCKLIPLDDATTPLQQLAVSGDEISNWRPESDMELYIGTQLYDKIDGGAPQYLEKGLIKTGCQRFNGASDALVDSYIFDFGSEEKAIAMYREMQLQVAGNTVADLAYPEETVTVSPVLGGVTGYARFRNFYLEISVIGFADQRFAIKTLDLFLGLYEKKIGL